MICNLKDLTPRQRLQYLSGALAIATTLREIRKLKRMLDKTYEDLAYEDLAYEDLAYEDLAKR